MGIDKSLGDEEAETKAGKSATGSLRLSDEDREKAIGQLKETMYLVLDKRIAEILQEGKKKFSIWSKIGAFLGSGIGLLLIGAGITSYLVPKFQREYEHTEAERKAKQENGAYKLGRLRECFAQFQSADAQIALAHNVFHLAQETSQGDRKSYAPILERLASLESQRIARCAIVQGLIAFAPEGSGREALKVDLEHYNVACTTNYDDTRQYIAKLMSRTVDEKLREKIASGSRKKINGYALNFQKDLMKLIKDAETRYESSDLNPSKKV